MRLRKTLVPGLAFFGFAALLCCPPSCKAQEVNPDHFTDKGVETFPERTQPVVLKKAAQAAPEVAQTSLKQPVSVPRKTARASSKKKTASTSGK